MSRIGKTPVKIPAGVTVTNEGNLVSVKGKLGELNYTMLEGISVNIDENAVSVSRSDDTREQKSRHGLTRALINNMVIGVSEGYQKTLQVIGTGYSAEVIGKWLKLSIGYSHEILLEVPEGITVEAEAVPRSQSKTGLQSIIRVKGIMKEDVGKFAAEVRKCRPPINYNKGKGIRYEGEFVKIKPGKSGAA